MRNNIVHQGADELTYEIREIVKVALKVEKTGVPIIWENIGDPVAKGEAPPQWLKDIVSDTAKNDGLSYAYSPTQGLNATREYIAKERNLEGGAQIKPEDILFFNGLGDAIATIYNYLNSKARIMGPNPAYSTHSSAEAGRAGAPHITYRLDPKNNWYPDMEDIRQKVRDNPDVSGILIINPDNPTGMVYPQEVIRQVVDIAREFDLFMVSDEIYSNLCYPGVEHKKLASVIGSVPGIALRGISKEFPWPGSRCGWAEFYNADKDASFARYIKTIQDAKMMEVCATTLPQKVLPKIMSDDRYYPYLTERTSRYRDKAKIACEIFSKVPGLMINMPKGAFYLTVVFEKGVLREGQKLVPQNGEAAKVIAPLLKTDKLDKQFVYHLLASRGICVVPLSTGFNSDLYGFRMTVLESDENKFKTIVEDIARAAHEYMKSK